MGSSMMGGGKGGSSGGGGSQNNAYSKSLANIARDYWAQTSPLRDIFIGDYVNFLAPGQYSGDYTTSKMGGGNTYGYTQYSPVGNPLAANPFGDVTPGSPGGSIGEGLQSLASRQSGQGMGGATSYTPATGAVSGLGATETGGMSSYNPYSLPAYQGLYNTARAGVEGQYNQARNQIMSQLPKGGQLNEALVNTSLARAQQAGALPAQISTGLIQDIMNKAYGLASGSPTQTMGGLGAASQGLGQAQQTAAYADAANAAASAKMMGGLGGGVGSLLGMGIGSMIAPGAGTAIGGGIGGSLGRAGK